MFYVAVLLRSSWAPFEHLATVDKLSAVLAGAVSESRKSSG